MALPLSFIKNLVSNIDIKVKISELELGLTNATHHSLPTAVNYKFPNVIIIYEDGITINEFAEFTALFKNKHPDTIPKIIFIAKEKGTGLKLLGECSNQIEIYRLGPTSDGREGLATISPILKPIDNRNKIVEMFFLEADGHQNNLIVKDSSPVANFTMRVMNSIVELRSHNKYNAQNKVNRLVEDLENLQINTMGNADIEQLLTIRSIANLWYAYINETGKEKLQNTIAFAGQYKLDLLKAQALKCSILISGYSSATEHYLSEARRIFDALQYYDYSAMTQNNINVNNIYQNKINIDELMNLSDFVTEELSHLRRTTTFHSNAGIGLMLRGYYDKADTYFNRSISESSSGPPINRLTSEVNYLVSRFMSGEKLDSDIAYELITKINWQVPRQFNYHITTLYSNLLGIFANDKAISDLIKQKLKSGKYMRYDRYIDDHRTLSQYIMANYPSSKLSGIKRLPGAIGDFAIDHGFLLAAHVYYR